MKTCGGTTIWILIWNKPLKSLTPVLLIPTLFGVIWHLAYFQNKAPTIPRIFKTVTHRPNLFKVHNFTREGRLQPLGPASTQLCKILNTLANLNSKYTVLSNNLWHLSFKFYSLMKIYLKNRFLPPWFFIIVLARHIHINFVKAPLY